MRQCASAFCRHIARDRSQFQLSKKPLREAGKARPSVKVVRASVEPGVFIHISFAIARVSAKEQQELAMCWRWDRVSKMYGSAIVIDTRTEGSKGFGHGSFDLGLPVFATITCIRIDRLGFSPRKWISPLQALVSGRPKSHCKCLPWNIGLNLLLTRLKKLFHEENLESIASIYHEISA